MDQEKSRKRCTIGKEKKKEIKKKKKEKRKEKIATPQGR